MSLPSIVEAMEFRRDAYGLTQREWAAVLGMQPSHYSSFVHGRIGLPKAAMARAFEFGVPATCLFQCAPNKHAMHIREILDAAPHTPEVKP